MIKEITIENYKSIVDLTLELGKTNVFIGENGCGKTNILEAFAMLSAAKNDRLTPQDLSNIGVRVAKPSLTRSSFASIKNDREIFFKIRFKSPNDIRSTIVKSTLVCKEKDTIYSKWIEREREEEEKKWRKLLTDTGESGISNFMKLKSIGELPSFFNNFIIYDLNTPALRGQTPQSFKSPLGINGEGLDVAFASLGKKEMTKLLKHKYLISWLDEIILDTNDDLKFNNLRIKGNSQLYFSDKFMKKNVLFNSENANEGVLHILFYLTLFLHKETSKVFAIDNIETALNPHLCRELMKTITELNKDKQVLITTHNPAILDGLNLMDDNVRLFTVRRNRKGYTEASRIQFKKGTEKKHKLSEMWMRGMLGAISTNF